MSRHRNVRGLNLDDEIDDYDAYGQSIDDDYCISPGTVAQFTFNRDDERMTVSSFMHDKIPEEENESDDEDMVDGRQRVGSFSRPQLSDTDQARLNSCLDELHSILGEAYSDTVLIRSTISNGYDVERVLNQLLEPEDVPKPQRQPRQNRRTQGDDENEDDSGDESAQDGVMFFNSPIVYINCPSGRLKFGEPDSEHYDCKLLSIDVLESSSKTNQNLISNLADKENIPSRINASSQFHSPRHPSKKTTHFESKHVKPQTDIVTILPESVRVSGNLKTSEINIISDLDRNIQLSCPCTGPAEVKTKAKTAFVFNSPLSHLKEKSLEIKNKKSAVSPIMPMSQNSSSIMSSNAQEAPCLKRQEPIFSLNDLIKKHASNQNVTDMGNTKVSSLPPPVSLSNARGNVGYHNHSNLKQGQVDDAVFIKKLASGIDTRPEKQIPSLSSLMDQPASVSNVNTVPESKLSLSELVHQHANLSSVPAKPHTVSNTQSSSSPLGLSLSALAQHHKALHVKPVIASDKKLSDKQDIPGSVDVSSNNIPRTDILNLSDLIKTHRSSKQNFLTQAHDVEPIPNESTQIDQFNAKPVGLPAGFDLTQLLSLNVKTSNIRPSTLSTSSLNISNTTCSTDSSSKTEDDIAQMLSSPLSPFNHPTSTDAFIQKYQRPSSMFGKVLSLRLRNLDENKLLKSPVGNQTSASFHQFSYRVQNVIDATLESVMLHNVTPFTFMTLSPDDIALQKQQQAFKSKVFHRAT